METPTPICESDTISQENPLLEINLQYENNNFKFIFKELNNFKINIQAKIVDNQEALFSKYESEVNFELLKKKNKYFSKFNNSNDLKNNFIHLCKSNNIKINEYNDKKIIININLIEKSENLLDITLKKVEITQNEKIELLLKDLTIKDKKIKDLNLQIKELKQFYDNKIISLEKCVKELFDYLINPKNKMDNKSLRNSVSLNSNSSKILNSSLSQKINDDILFGSSIFTNQNEIDFIFKAISPKKKISLKLLFSSKTNGENIDDLKASYLDKNDLLFLIKTNKDKIFGGYAHESFKDKEFEKKDKKAFLFSINKLKIYRSQNYCTIWKNAKNINSINFGGGVDLKICHNFLSGENYTNQNSKIYFAYDDEEFALNGEKFYTISILEIFKVIKYFI